MSNIFLSYKTEDRHHAERLAAALEAKGHEVWWDHLLKAGEDYRTKIMKQIERCDVTIVIWTPQSVESAFVIDEASRATDRRKLLPVMIKIDENGREQKIDIPLGLASIHAEDLTYWDGNVDDLHILKLTENITSISNGFWKTVYRTRDIGKVSIGFWQAITTDISTDIGGLPYKVLVLGSISLSIIGCIIFVFGLSLQAVDGGYALPLSPMLMVMVTFPAIALLIGLIRTMFQFVYVTTGRRSRQFFDSSFTLIFIVAVLLSILRCVVLLKDPEVGIHSVLIIAPLLTLVVLFVFALVRISLIGGKILFHRL